MSVDKIPPDTLGNFWDLDASHQLSFVWNEDDSADRIFNILVHGANRTLDLNESLTIGDGYSGTITFSAEAKVLTIDETTTLSAKANSDSQITPLMWSIAVSGADSIGQGTWAITLASVLGYVTFYNSTHANGDNCTCNFRCPAGTYTLRFGFLKDSNIGICDVYIDDTEEGSFDGYAASANGANIEQIAGLSLSAGAHTIKFQLDGKNASSSNYYINLSYICFQRTA